MVGKEMTEELVVAILKAAVKQRRESIAEYQAAARPELEAIEAAELEILLKYLPAELDEATIRQTVSEVITRVGSTAGFGSVMAAAMKELAGRADGAAVNKIVKELLG